MTVLLPLLPGTLPPGACYATEQERLIAFAEVLEAQLAGGLAFYNYGSDVPDVENQGYPWLNTNDTQWYVFSGSWRRKRPGIELDSNYRVLYIGLEADVPNFPAAYGYSGGAAVSTVDTGPFFEIDHTFDGRSPMGPGTIPTSNPTKVLTVAELFGEGAHTQTEQELVPHNHPAAEDFNNFAGFVTAGQPSSFEITGGSEIERMPLTGDTGGGEAMPIIHPVVGVWFLKPTIREWITAS